MKNILFFIGVFIWSIAPGQSWTKQYDHVNEPCCGLAKVGKDHKYGFVNAKGKVVIPLIYDEVLNFSEGIAAVSKAAKWGFVDSTGKEITPLQYSDALSFTEGAKAHFNLDFSTRQVSLGPLSMSGSSFPSLTPYTT